MLRNIIIKLTFLQSLALIIALCSIIVLYIDLGHIPFHQDPEPHTFKYLFIINLISDINLINLSFSFFLIITWSFYLFYSFWKKVAFNNCYKLFSFQILIFILTCCYFYRITGWLLD